MKPFLLIILFLSGAIASAQTQHLVFKESGEDFANPERGFYLPFTTSTAHFVPLDTSVLNKFGQTPQQAKSATYNFHGSLIYRAYVLEDFKAKPLGDAFLRLLQTDFDAVRDAGLKAILRFSYNDKTHGGDCPDEYKICPPYGDAPKAVVLQHIKQLAPLFRRNADVLAVLQMGFIGIWGENYFTDYFGDASTNRLRYIPDSSWRDRNEVLKALLNALPADRMVQVRTPQIKQRFVYGPLAAVASEPLLEKEAFAEKDNARIGFHNDCFLASADDYGTFYDYGNSTSERGPANEVLRHYFEKESRYTAVGGETCDDAFSPQNDCGGAEKAMAAMHYSYLNAAYNNAVNNDWDSGGCIDVIRRSLGYRFVLRSADLPVSVQRGGALKLKLALQNKGFAAPYNPRPVQVVLRNEATGAVIVFPLKANVRKWFPGDVVVEEAIALPVNMRPGRYEALLNLPDAYPSLSQRPAYSIRLANENVWEAATGYNNLHCMIAVK